MDPIVAAALAAVNGLTAGNKAVGASGQGRVPMVTEKSAAPASAGAASAGSIVTAAMRGSGYLGIDDEPAGSSLNPIAQLGLFAKIRQESSWLRFATFAPVTETTGYLDTWDDRSFRMHPMPTEAPRSNIPVHKPDVDQVSFSTSLLSGAFGIRLQALRTAARSGQDVNALVRRGVAAGIGNVLADLGVNGDSTLPSDTSQNMQRATLDGWFAKIRSNGTNYVGQADGFSYHNGIWAGMLQSLDKAYRMAPGLAWGLSDTLSTRWLTEMTAMGDTPSNAHPSIINDFGSQLLNAMGAQANPLGKPGVVIPQIPDDRWSSDEGYDGMAPTSIVNNGDGTLTININTLATSGVDRSSTGTDGQRYVTVTHVSSGVEETLAVAYAAPNNTVTTASLLGQVAPSTTASDYVVKWADLQPLFLGAMNFLSLVVKNGMRVYTVFYPHHETIEVIVHMDVDYVVVDYDAVALTDDIITPRFSVLPN